MSFVKMNIEHALYSHFCIRTITDKMKSSANLGFFPSKQILRKALLADENEHVGDVLAKLTGDFIDGFTEMIREIFST